MIFYKINIFVYVFFKFYSFILIYILRLYRVCFVWFKLVKKVFIYVFWKFWDILGYIMKYV